MNVFSTLPIYGSSWNVKSSRSFEAEEINAIKSASVVASEYGLSVCFTMVAGGKTYIPLSNQSSLGVGDSVDITKAKLLTLERDGNEDIMRVDA